MEKVIVTRSGELFLKGKNKVFFENLLISDIKLKLKDINCSLFIGRGRYIVESFNESDTELIISKLKKVFGLHSISVALKCKTDIELIKQASISLLEGKRGTFKVEANRANKSFYLNSIQICCLLGDFILQNNCNLSVNLHNPEIVLNVDIRDEGYTFIYSGRILGLGGLPLNSSGRGLMLLSGGIDSPVAAFMMAKRGLNLTCLHFHSYPYTNEKSQQKVIDLSKKLCEYTNKITLINVKMTRIQEEIYKNCENSYLVTLLRYIMMEISKLLAFKFRCECVVNGESLGQVASQTIEGLVVSSSAIDIPVLRPLIALDKQEIIDRAKDIGTYNISILPFEDCCTVFLPEHPATKPTIHKTKSELEKIPNLNELILEAVENIEILHLNNGKLIS